MTEEVTRLKKFLTDQEESVQLARSTADGSDSLRVDAINAALSLAHTNAVAANRETTMKELLSHAREAAKFLKGEPES